MKIIQGSGQEAIFSTLKAGQLSEAYEGWELTKYNEDVGTMHNGAQLQFATMLARKPD